MLYVARNREIIFNWYLYEGTNKRVVDFTEIPGCRPTAFLVNKKGQYTYRLEYQFDASAVPFVRIVIPKDSLTPDTYDMKIIWEVPEEKDIRMRLRHNNRFLAVSHIAGVMKITSNASEDNTGLPVGETLVRTVKSLSESFGYDGLSAYELAVLRKGYTGTEEEYITQFERVPLYRTADTDSPDDERALSSLRAYRDFVEKERVVRNTDIDGQDTEDTSRVPSAYALKYVKDLITPISELQGVGVLSKTASGWAFTQFPEGLQLGEDSDTAYAGDKGKKNREDIDALQRRVDELPDTVASKEELKALEDKVGNKIIDLNQQVTGVEKDVADKASASDLEELRDYISDGLSPKGSNTRPIYIDEEGAKEVDGIVVPKDIISLTGGVAAKGIADFGIVTGGGTGGDGATQLTELTDVAIYDPKEGEVLTYNSETNKWVNKDNDVDTLINNKVDKEDIRSKGTTKLPIYIDEDAVAREVTGIEVDNDIVSKKGGVSARGIADFSISETGNATNVEIETKVKEGVQLAIITVNGTEHSIYAPEIDESLQDIFNNHIEDIRGKGSDKTPIYIDNDAKAQEVTSIEVLGDIRSLHGGVSAHGISDLSNTKQGTDVKVTPLTTEGEAIANIEVDGIENIIYAPKADNSTKDNEQDDRIAYLETLFDDKGKVKDADKLDGKSIEELFDSIDSNGGINLVIGGVSKSVTKSELLRMLGFDNKGSRSLPVYYENEELKEIDSLSVDGHIESKNGGVSARGIADLSVTSVGGSGSSNITILKNNELEEVEYEDITHTASAYSTKLIKDIINVDEIEGFLPDKEYEAGVLVKYNNKIYQFTDNHKGNWDSGIVKRFKLNEIANPIAISNTELDYMFNL